MRGSSGNVPGGTCETTLARAETSQVCVPRWSDRDRTLGDDGHPQRVRERAVVAGGDDGRQRLDAALERRRRRGRRGSCRRTAPARAAPVPATAGVPPRTSIRPTAKTEVSRATAYAPPASASSPSPTASERREGMKLARRGRPAPHGRRRSAPRGRAAPLDAWRPHGQVRRRRVAPTGRSRAERREGERAEELDLVPSSTPNCSRARRRASAISATASARASRRRRSR